MPKALKTSFHKRRVIMELHNEGKTTPEIMQITGCTYFQVYNVIRHRVKKTPADDIPRQERDLYETPQSDDEDDEDTDDTAVDISQFENPEAFFEHQIALVLTQLNRLRLVPEKRVKLLKDLIILQKNLKIAQVEAFAREPNAMLVVNIMKRLAPKLSDEEIIRILEEEREKIALSKNK